ncbi:hypothetical protein MA05_06105 [Comamonas aquatica]|nr:hypothetical protein MA05_06105 [Comamonas aquatica]
MAAGKKPGSKGFLPAKANTGGAGEVRIIGGQWRRTRLAVAQRPGLAALAQQLERLGQQLKAEGVHVQRGDGVAALAQSAPGHWHVVFIDPPFAAEALFGPAMKAAAQAVADDGFIYLEAPKAWTEDELAALGLHLHRYLKAGAVHAHLLQKLPG